MPKKKNPPIDEKGPAAAAEALTPEPAPASIPYLVLARKYRPSTFEELIGQDAMVRTLKNAFLTGRIAQAYMLTGVRGVGKTTTARILARALNYSRPGEVTGPSIGMPGPGEHCQAIMESRHLDVIEMDAASHTGIDDIREIIESARYKPAYARYKVYIIDEVHMLSKAAFNGLLKTLEEPPGHVKFVFATTEVRKVPVTVLSRCQRFDLRRVGIDLLTQHFAKIAALEGQRAGDEALLLMARAAEGSVRDGLSLLDRAFALGQGEVRAADVRAMLGLADRARIFGLLDAVLKGAAAAALRELQSLYEAGADPEQTLADLADAVHAVSRIKAAGIEAASPGLSEAERKHAEALAAKLSLPVLARAWQTLLKGLEEAARAPRTAAAAEMVLIRLCYMADLPTPDDVIRSLSTDGQTKREPSVNESATAHVASLFEDGQPPRPSRTSGPAPDSMSHPAEAAPQPPAPGPGSAVKLANFAGVAALAGAKRDVKLKIALEEYARLVRFRPGHVELQLLGGAPKDLANDLARKLGLWTGERWMVSLTEAPGEKPLGEQRRELEAQALEEVKRHPAVQAVFRHFPQAQITAVRDLDIKPQAGPSGHKSGKTSRSGD